MAVSNTVVNSQIPESFICALTGEIMQEPVIDNEGNTYEKKAILVNAI